MEGSGFSLRALPHPEFSGWRVCAFAALTQAVAIGFTLGAVGLFAVPMAEDLGATATQFNLAVSIFSLVMNLSMPAIGRFLDRGSIRAVMTTGAAVLSASLLLMSRATQLWQVGLLFGVGCSIGMTMLGPIASSTAMASWFDRFRGRALGIANAGAPAGPVVIVPIAAYAIASVGWRSTLLGFAVLSLIVALPAIRFGLIDHPSAVGQFPDGDEPPERTAEGGPDVSAAGAAMWDARGIVRCRDFWLLALAVAPFGAQGIVLGANAIPFLLHQGATVQAASFAPIPMSIGAITGPLVLGSLADRIHPRLLFMALCVTICLAFAGLMSGPGYAASLALFAVCGVVGGSMMPIYGALVGRLFGVSAFGQVMGLAALVGVPVIFLAPVLFGYAFDYSGSYALGLAGLIASLLVSTGLFSFLGSGEARRSAAPEAAAPS